MNCFVTPDYVPSFCSSLSTDVIGVCKTVDEVTRLTTKSNREVSKRTVGLMDMSGKVVTVTLWGEEVSAGWLVGEAVGTQVSLRNRNHFLTAFSKRLGAVIGFGCAQLVGVGVLLLACGGAAARSTETSGLSEQTNLSFKYKQASLRSISGPIK